MVNPADSVLAFPQTPFHLQVFAPNVPLAKIPVGCPVHSESTFKTHSVLQGSLYTSGEAGVVS